MRFAAERLEAASRQAMVTRASGCRNVESLLKPASVPNPTGTTCHPSGSLSTRCAAPPMTTDPEGRTLLTTPTVEKLRGLNLTGMARALDE